MRSADHEMELGETPVFTAELRPYRSLGRVGLKVVVFITLAIGLVNVIFFLATGAWPIAFFFGLDVALLYGAFWLNYRAARAREEVQLSRTCVKVRKISPNGAVQEWKDNPFWSRFDVTRQDDIGITGMALIGRASGRTEIGTFLNPDDKENFAKAFMRAMATIKRRL